MDHTWQGEKSWMVGVGCRRKMIGMGKLQKEMTEGLIVAVSRLAYVEVNVRTSR